MADNALALITGGSGYFGSVLVRELRRHGHPCRVFDLRDAPDRPSDVEFVQGDILDPDALVRACAGVDCVYHNVAMVPLGRSPAEFKRVNVEGTRRLLGAARAAGVRKIVHTSSSAVYGRPDENPVRPDTRRRPQEAYGDSKLDAERLCEEYAREGGDVTIIRPRTILGHGRLGIFQILFEWIREGANIPVLGDGANRYQFIHADDLADACRRAGSRPGARAYLCGADRFGTMRELLEGLCAYAGTGSRVRGVPLRLAEAAMRLTSSLRLTPLAPYHALMYGHSMWFDIAETQRDLGWSPRYSNEDMIRQSYDWYLEHRTAVLGGTGQSAHRSRVTEGFLSAVRWLL